VLLKAPILAPRPPHHKLHIPYNSWLDTISSSNTWWTNMCALDCFAHMMSWPQSLSKTALISCTGTLYFMWRFGQCKWEYTSWSQPNMYSHITTFTVACNYANIAPLHKKGHKRISSSATCRANESEWRKEWLSYNIAFTFSTHDSLYSTM
jgi:hypothetical protein